MSFFPVFTIFTIRIRIDIRDNNRSQKKNQSICYKREKLWFSQSMRFQLSNSSYRHLCTKDNISKKTLYLIIATIIKKSKKIWLFLFFTLSWLCPPNIYTQEANELNFSEQEKFFTVFLWEKFCHGYDRYHNLLGIPCLVLIFIREV